MMKSRMRRRWGLLISGSAMGFAVGLTFVHAIDADMRTDDEQRGNSPKASFAQKTQRSGWTTHRDAERYSKFQHPSSWKVATGLHIDGLHRDVFLTINNAGRDDFWLTELRRKDQSLGSLLPRGTAYLEFSFLAMPGDPVVPGPSEAHEPEPDLAQLFRQAKEGTSHDEVAHRGFGFSKWGSTWNVLVYFFEPVEAETREAVVGILESLEFDAVPVGYKPWAVREAIKHLPPELGPLGFSMGGQIGNHWTRSEVICNEVLVSFGEIDPTRTKGQDDEDAPTRPDRIWQFRVTAQGEVIPTLKPNE